MKLEEIQNLWEEDAKIDRSQLDGESLKVPLLHHKYYKIFIQEKVKLNEKKSEYSTLERDKWEYYMGKYDQELLEARKWEANPKKILKTDVKIYIDADQDIIKLRREVAFQEEKVLFLAEIIKTINQRTYIIKNAIEFIKWSQGS